MNFPITAREELLIQREIELEAQNHNRNRDEEADMLENAVEVLRQGKLARNRLSNLLYQHNNVIEI